MLLFQTSNAFPSWDVPFFFLASKNDLDAYKRVSYRFLLLLGLVKDPRDLDKAPNDGARLCVLSSALG